MIPAFETLTKILGLEKQQGFEDRAVIGGMAKFLQIWGSNAAQECATGEEKALVTEILALLKGYSELGRTERARAVENALARVMSPQPRQPGSEPSQRLPRPAIPADVPEASPLDIPVEELRGISQVYARRLGRLGVETVEDLLYLFPRRYDDFSALKQIRQLQYGEEVTIVGTIWETHNRQSRRGQTITQTILSDGTGTIQITWFNQPYLAQQLRPGREIVVSGRVDEFLGQLTFSSPEWEPLQKNLLHTGRLVPIYPLTQGLTQRWMRRTMRAAVDAYAGQLVDALPTSLRLRQNLMDLTTSIQQIHFPDNKAMMERARHRLCFEEFLLIQLGVSRQRYEWQQQRGQPLVVDEVLLQAMISALPFSLTGAQQRALQEIRHDLQKDKPMSRLLQGDVGSGKTVVALLAMLLAVANGMQAAIMVPTEILAEQHHRTIQKTLEQMSTAAETQKDLAGHQGDPLRDLVRRVRLRLLTGSVPRQEKEEIHREIETGEANLVVGTHALIQEGVTFANLALAIVDEQHRFGVSQRAALRQKTFNPHVLVMSATPIPRTLALTIYGDLDISVIDELPPNRQRVETRWLYPRERERAYAFVRSQIAKGRQAFIICPLIEESEKSDAKAAVSEYERLQEQVFPDLRLGLLHGRMKGADKERVMTAFERKEYQILVSTSVVEVGIDVPNATVMLVEGANRFGLAQLHQFRGRVGRGEHQSYCLLLSDSPTEAGEQRLQIIENTHDGFALAEEDLKMRGPGEFFGTRQSGLPDLKVARLGDVGVLEKARKAAVEVFEQDPLLERPEHRLLAVKLERFWRPAGDLS